MAVTASDFPLDANHFGGGKNIIPGQDNADLTSTLNYLKTAAVDAGSDAIADTNSYYTTDTVDGAADALGVQLGGDDDATFAFTDQNILTDDDPVYSALDQLDGWAGPDQIAESGTGVTATVEAGAKKLILTLTAVDVAMVDEAGVVAYGGLKIADFTEGYIMFLGAVADLALTKSSAGVNTDWDGDFALGTVTASNNATLASTEQDIIPTTATPQAVAGATTATGVSTATEAPVILDGATTAKDVFLNILVDDADHDVTSTPCNIIVNGTITISYMHMGDF